MKYSEQTYREALASLARLLETLEERERPTLDFVAEAIAEKADRDYPSAPSPAAGEPLTQENLERMQEALDFARSKDGEIIRLGQKLQLAEERAERAEKKLTGAEDSIAQYKKIYNDYREKAWSNYKKLRKACDTWKNFYKSAAARAEKAERARDAAINLVHTLSLDVASGDGKDLNVTTSKGEHYFPDIGRMTPLTKEDFVQMHFERVWIDYGTDEEGKRFGEDGVVLYGKLYSIDMLDGAGLEELLLDTVGHGGDTLDTPGGTYTLYRCPPEDTGRADFKEPE